MIIVNLLHDEADSVRAGKVDFLLHALVVPAADSEEQKRYDAEMEAIAVRVATAFEAGSGAEVTDVSRPAKARRAELSDWPGLDLDLDLDLHPRHRRTPPYRDQRCAGTGSVEISDNEWDKACNLREYWLYVVYDCATPSPRLIRVQDPFAELIVRGRNLNWYTLLRQTFYRPSQK